MSAIPAKLQAVRLAMKAAASRAGRDPDSVQLLAVSKTKPAADVLEAALAGQRDFGENYVQEGVDKIAALGPLLPPGCSLVWHFIGPLQSNKTRPVAEHFDWVHSIDRLKVAQRLSGQRPAHLAPLQVCVQVNVSGEASKSGCAPAEVADLCRAVAALPRLRLRGLMTIPAPVDDFESQRRPLRQLRLLQADLVAQGLALDTLSMGMSHDLEAAIFEGSTLVRVGTAIFGARNTI
ncbi:MAG: YggS family pyridoxal phosphate-dependent enzyme [Azovibrio sp.]|uniref:YggS family pyridoxal phosphate-dependent enzyme n=1 Tax=Azovibrio sp. TaxID=1872673 RepID=UPI003C784C47